MQRLNLARQYDFEIRAIDGKDHILDPLRRKFVRLTPEEWVRQNFAQFLIEDRGYPRGLMAIERAFDYGGLVWRADVVACDRAGKPLLVAECKAPQVRLDEKAFEQIERYNRVLQAQCLIVTNGLLHYCYGRDTESDTYAFLRDVPPYASLVSA
jgi:hypothetical protein